MINGATQIISNVPGQYLNPLLVAESQAESHSGYIVVIYNREPKQYDLLFLQGRVITHCARMNKDLRFFIDQHVVTTTFRDHQTESLISLFTCDDESVQRFITTFHSEPCLKVHVDALSKNQILALIKSTSCMQGIIERNNFSAMLPTIELKEIDAVRKLPPFKTGLTHGRLLVYDLLKNQEIQSHRFAGQPLVVHPVTSLKRKRRVQKNAGRVATNSEPSTDHEHQRSSPTPKDPAEAVEALIQEILGSTKNQSVPEQQLDNTLTIGNSPLAIDHSNSVPSPPPVPTESGSPVDPTSSSADYQNDSEQLSTSNNQPHRHDQPQSTPPKIASDVQPATQETLQTQQTTQTEQTLFTRTMDRLIRSFRQQVVELCTQRAESIFAAAEKKTRVLNPDFDPRLLNENNAIIVLELIEEMVKQAPLLKRSKLRETASELVSDLYNKQYDLLEEHKAIDAVEQCYYRLKGSKS